MRYNSAMAKLKLSLLGPFQAVIDDQEISGFPTDKVRGLLAFLAMEPGRPHRRDTLASLLWPDWPDEDARRNLRQSLHRLRQTVDAAAPGLAERLLAAGQTTIQVDPSELWLDVAEFRGLLAEVETHRHRNLHTCLACLQRLAQAVDLYRGELLAGLSLPDASTFEEWQTIQREALHYQAVSALQSLAEAHEQRGDYGATHNYAMRVLALEPWQEAAHRLAMRALAFSGQRGEALAHFETCQRVLESELGVEPSDETKALYWQIASGDLGTSSDQGRRGRAELHHFPAQFTRFVGRRGELAQILEHLSDPDRRLLTLVGPGGMGKTRLAIEAASQAAAMAGDFADGIFFVPLADVAGSDLLAPALANGLGLPLHEELPRSQLLAYLRPKRMLLVLDNFEHLLDAVGLIGEVLRLAPGVQLLVTSQKPLELRAEWRITLNGLDYPASGQVGAPAFEDYSAVQLFLHAARQVLPGFSPDPQDQAAIVRICQLTHGMPLAIELAAAWVRLVGCAAIAEELHSGLDLLATGLRDVPERHRSLRAVFDYAWRLLTPSEQAALARVSVFHGAFTLPAALAVTETSVIELSCLLDRSLLGRTGQGRFVVHPLVRQFAADLLRAMGLEETLRTKHMQYYGDLVRERSPSLRAGSGQLQDLAAMEEDLENAVAAWQWAVQQGDSWALSGMMDGLFNFWTIRSRFQEGEMHFGQAVVALQGRDDHPVLLANLGARLAWFVFQQGQHAESRRLLMQSVERLRAEGAGSDLVFSLAYLGALLRHVGDYDAARAVLDEGLRLAEAANDGYYASVILNARGQVALAQNRYAEAQADLERALLLKRQIGDRWGMTFSLSYLGRLAQAQGNYRQAGELQRESLALSQEFGDRRGVAFSLRNLGDSALSMGHREEAARLYRQSLQVYEEIGSPAQAERSRARLVEVE